MGDPAEKELKRVLAILPELEQLVTNCFERKKFRLSYKKRGEPVTSLDKEINRILKKSLWRKESEGWISEETLNGKLAFGKNRVWIVDPLDGTKELLRGVDEFATSIALIAHSQTILGVVFNPLRHECFSALAGQGARLNGKRLHISDRHGTPKRARWAVSRTDTQKGLFRKSPYKKLVPVGSIAYKLAVVAAGRYDGTFSLTPKSVWDYAAGALIVKEAGGTVTDLEGWDLTCLPTPSNRISGLVAANPWLHGRLMKEIKNDGYHS